MIRFRIFSKQNVEYKWSLYEINSNNDEEYIESCSLYMDDIIKNAANSKRSQSTNLDEIPATKIGGVLNKQFKIKFQKTGIILIFYLYYF